MNILCIGDIVGKPGRKALESLLKDLKQELKIDFVIVNAENAAGGAGLTARIADQLLNIGCDVITLGDHVWDQKDLEEYLSRSSCVIRPANFPHQDVPGKGWCVKKAPNGTKIAVINLLGRVFMRYQVQCPFKTLEDILSEINGQAPIVLVDMHAETTSEKVALGHFADGKISALFGTHTHIQTADDTILKNGTAYITDLGMTGPYDSVIGQDKDRVIKRFLTSMPLKFHVAEANVKLCGICVHVDDKTGKARNISRIQRVFDYKPVENKTQDGEL